MSTREAAAPSPAMQPVVRELDRQITPLHAFRTLRSLPYVVFFDSAMTHAEVGRYSFVAADPFDWITLPADGGDVLRSLEAKLAAYSATTLPELPPFQGGAAGLFGYELCHSLEQLPRPNYDEFKVPAIAAGLYDVVVAFDHLEERAWIVSQGLPENDAVDRQERAEQRAGEIENLLLRSTQAASEARKPGSMVSAADLAPQHDTQFGVTSDFARSDYLAAVSAAIDYIHAGDIFQVNLSQRLLRPQQGESPLLYEQLRQHNPAPFAGYFDLGDYQVVSASPERFLQVGDGVVETRPIKGTRPRIARPEADLFTGDELSQSEKDLAENVMIVDLLRNDLSRVCRPGSVQVTKLCGLETYAHVKHLVSVVRAKLQPHRTPLDLLRASFPGGSITGAPKVRAMEIISELEPTARGAYCGSLAYIGFDGTTDSNLLIRTITAGRGWWQLPVGGGIVANSDPRSEYEETWHKAAGLLQAMEITSQQ